MTATFSFVLFPRRFPVLAGWLLFLFFFSLFLFSILIPPCASAEIWGYSSPLCDSVCVCVCVCVCVRAHGCACIFALIHISKLGGKIHYCGLGSFLLALAFCSAAFHSPLSSTPSIPFNGQCWVPLRIYSASLLLPSFRPSNLSIQSLAHLRRRTSTSSMCHLTFDTPISPTACIHPVG